MRQELHHHADRSTEVDLDFFGDRLEIVAEGLQVDFAHHAGIVDEHVQPRKLGHDSAMKFDHCARVAHVTLKRVQTGEFLARGGEGGGVASRHDDGVLAFQQFGRELQADAARAASDEDRISAEFHGFSPGSSAAT